MSKITKEFFGLYDDKEIHRFTLMNAKGNRVSVINYGGTVISWILNDENGKARNIVAGFDTLQEYRDATAYFGCIAGRYANRIANGHFSINGTNYVLACNDGKNHLHGGNRGFDKKVWDATVIEKDSPVLSLNYFSRDGEEGYPGSLDVTAEFSYTDDDELVIRYSAETDKPTPINLTSHCYFNLSGDMGRSILDHSLQVNADHYTPLNAERIPTGELIPVAGTGFDFREPASIKDNLERSAEEYDHNFVLNKNGNPFSFAALLAGPGGHPKMAVFTTEPGLQFYTGNLLDGSSKNRDGKGIGKYSALCLETQHFPDSPNQPQFPSTILMPGKKFFSKTVYKVSAE